MVVRKDGEDTHKGKGRGLLIFAKAGMVVVPIKDPRIDNINQAAGVRVTFDDTSNAISCSDIKNLWFSSIFCMGPFWWPKATLVI